MLKTAITLIMLFWSVLAFSQTSEITNILNRELRNEINYPLENDDYLKGHTIAIVKGFSIDHNLLSITVKKSLADGYVIETRSCPLAYIDMISIVDHRIKLKSRNFELSQTNPVTYEYHYRDGRTRKETLKEFGFETYIHFPNKKHVAYELKKAFKKIGKSVIVVFHTSLDNTFEDMAAYENAQRAAIAEEAAGQ